MVEIILLEVQGPGIVRRAYAVVVERSWHVVPSPSVDSVAVVGSRQDVETTIGSERTIEDDPSCERSWSRLCLRSGKNPSHWSHMLAVGYESVGYLVPIA